MLKFEDSTLEKAVLSGESCIAVPLEVFLKSDGETEILTYSFCEKEAKEFCKKFGGTPFSDEALSFADRVFGEKLRGLGYEHYAHEGELMREYILSSEDSLPLVSHKVRMISTNEELSPLCENTGCEIELNDDGEDLLFAVVQDGEILAYAGMNDVQYADGSVEISVETSPDYRRQGLGITCVTELCRHILKKGNSVRYKSAKSNLASCALAEKCGFSLVGERYSYICGIAEDS